MMRNMAKRGHGEGTIRPRADRGLWEARYRDGDGRQRSLYAPTRREVQAKLNAVRHAIVEGALIGGRHETVGQFLERWLDAVASQRVRPRTFERYQGVVSKHLAPELGHLPLPKLTPQHIERLYVAKRGDLSPAGVRYIHQVLHAALAHAARMRMIAYNPADGVAPPRPVQQEMLYLAPDEARRFLTLIEDEPLGPLYTLAMTTGMRLGELLGLRWQAISGTDLEVRVALIRVGGAWSLSAPKTPKSRRRIALSTTAQKALKRQRRLQAEARLRAGLAWTDYGLVFTDEFGEPLTGSRITERRLRPLMRREGLPPIRFHDLRHTAATLMLTAGVNPKVVSEMLGHTSVAITLDRYSHVLPTMQAEAVRRLDDVLSGRLRVQTRVRRIPRPRKRPDSRSESGLRDEIGTAYRIRTGDLRLERAVS
jgi:integrase